METNNTSETWVITTGYDREYLVSDLGNIKSTYHGRLMRPWTNYEGYVLINLRKNRCAVVRLVHRLVWEAFNGIIPTKMEINHKNGDKSNNQLSNLELVTSAENNQHAYATGLRVQKLHPEKISEMVEAIRCGSLSKAEAAEKYNIKASTVTHHVRSRLGPQYIWKPGALRRRRKKA